jgi:hypothetical protein
MPTNAQGVFLVSSLSFIIFKYRLFIIVGAVLANPMVL